MKDRRQVYFLTSNEGKFREAAAVMKASGITLRMLNNTKIEIQSESLQEIAKYAAVDAADRLGIPVVAEDAGLFVDALCGFPGPYSSDVFKRIGIKGILTLMVGVRRRSAEFRSAVAFCSPRGRPRCFAGTVPGRIGTRSKGRGGFGFDPVFIPNRGGGKTFAEMTVREKNTMSHRATAFRKLSRWLNDASLNRPGSVRYQNSD